ncbi:MAG: hypothetical protein H7318_12290 [Oligoflexus sp.]|nr:hypothetical protein [Oligoflexus sp.]
MSVWSRSVSANASLGNYQIAFELEGKIIEEKAINIAKTENGCKLESKTVEFTVPPATDKAPAQTGEYYALNGGSLIYFSSTDGSGRSQDGKTLYKDLEIVRVMETVVSEGPDSSPTSYSRFSVGPEREPEGKILLGEFALQDSPTSALTSTTHADTGSRLIYGIKIK